MSALININNVDVRFEVVGDYVFADTLNIAEVFQKRHTDILRTIDNMCDDEFKSSNFKYNSYFDKQGKQRKCREFTTTNTKKPRASLRKLQIKKQS